MSKPSFLTDSLCRRSLSISIVSLISLTITIIFLTPLRANETSDRQEATRQIVQNYIQAGEKEYKQGFYEQAEKTFLMAQGYREYLSADERDELSSLLEKAQTAASKQKSAQQIFLSAQDLFKQNRLDEAKKNLEVIRDNEFLTAQDRKRITQLIREIDIQLIEAEVSSKNSSISENSEQTLETIQELSAPTNNENDIPAIYDRSMGLYRTGQFKEAKEGFLTVLASDTIPQQMAKTIESYIAQIDRILLDRVEPQTIPEVQQPRTSTTSVMNDAPVHEVIQPEMISIGTSGSTIEQGSFIDVVDQQRNIIRSRIKAVISDTFNKANAYMDENRFDMAKQAVQAAEIQVNENQMYLGNELYNQYKNQLNSLNQQIISREEIQTQSEEEIKRANALEENRRLREQWEADRQRQINELMNNALEYEEQDRYEAAIDQLDSLLALDPQHDEALLMKKYLEDEIFFRRGREIEDETNEQRAKLLQQTDEAQIPHADVVTYPKNWREITLRKTREPDKPFGFDPANDAVFQQLDQTIVDLSDITPETTVAEIINRLRSAGNLQIQPNWRDLYDMADIDRDTPAEMDPISGVSLGTALDVLLAGLSITDVAELGYVIDEGVILIATVESLPSNMVMRVYDIADLVGAPSTGAGGGMMGMGMMGGMMGGGMMGGMMGGGYGGGMMGGGYGGGMMGGGYGGGMMGGGYGGGMMGGGYGGGMMGGGYGGTMGGYGGGVGGYGGTMGGYGGGGYGGTMGGYGGGGYGGGYGGGGYGGGYGGGGYGGGYGAQASGAISQDLIYLIEESIDPESWYDISEEGDGSIYPYPAQQPKKLAVFNTPEVHSELEKLLEALRQALGHQVSIEARYLIVTENFLEDVGLDVDFTVNAGGNWGIITVDQASAATTTPDVATKISGSLGAVTAAAGVAGGYGSILDDLQVAFLLRATQAHTDSKALVAPMVTVLSGETANFQVSEQISYMIPPATTTTITPTGVGQAGTQTATTPQVGMIPLMIPLYVTPTIQNDKKNVLLNIQTQYQDLIRIRNHTVDYIDPDGIVQQFRADVPETQTTNLTTRVSVPDGGTLLLGGQRITQEIEKEAGVPILSKLPLLGRLFSNRSTIRDQKILLVLVRPTIILQEETEAEAMGTMEDLY